MLDAETKKHIHSARQVLLGKVPDPKSQIAQITVALIYKFMDDMDKASVLIGGNKTFFTGDFEKFAWDNLMSSMLDHQQRYNLYDEALEKLANHPDAPDFFRNIFRETAIPYRDGQTLTLFLKEIDYFKYEHSEQLGNAYEYLLQVMGSQGDAGQFRTPRHIIDFIVDVVDPNKDDRILDPACGTAGFLISAYKHIMEKHDQKDDESGEFTKEEKRLTSQERHNLMHNIHGYDLDPQMVRMSQINMFLHGFNTPNIQEYDTLGDDRNWEDRFFSVILANPPFMTPKGGVMPHNKFKVQSKRAEVLFVDYIAEHLNSNGRAGVIVPEGIIFQSGTAYKQLRKMLVEDNYLWAVVSLPSGVFQPYSGVKTSILLMDRERARQNKEILFVKVENDGFDLGAQRRPNGKNDLPESLKILNSWEKGEKIEGSLGNWVEKEKIAESDDYNLSSERYKFSTKNCSEKYIFEKLTNLCNLQNGYAFKSADYIDQSNTLLVRMSNIRVGGTLDLNYARKYLPDSFANKYKNYLLKDNDVIISMTDLANDPKILGIPTIIHSNGKNLLLNQRVGKFIDIKKDKLFVPYLSYILRSKSVKDYYKSLSGGGLQLNISKNDILSLHIPLPPLSVQKEIVEELDSYQKIIDGAKMVVENWKPRIKIEEGWELVKLSDSSLFKIESGGTPETKNPLYWDGEIKWITLVDLPQEDFISEVTTSKRKITDFGLRNSSAKLLPKETVIVSTRATIGRVGIANTELSTNQGFKNIIIVNKAKVNYKYLAIVMTTLKEKMNNLASGGTFKEISKSIFSDLEIPLPSIEVQNQLIEQFEDERKSVLSNKNLINRFEQKIKDRIEEVWSS